MRTTLSEAESLFGLKPLTVRELNERVKSCLEERFEWVAVAGEIADLARPRSGHVYFTLREADAQVRAVMWKGVSARQRTPLADGMQVIALGSLTVYPPRGVYQLVVSEVVPRGLGDIRRALEALRKKLEGEGLFDPARKKALPCLPFRLAVITSATGAAVQDILRTALSRFPQLVVRVFPVRVQGVNAPAEIVRALALANTPGAADVILLGRGGGSLDDLWAFNHEEVVRAVAASRLPVKIVCPSGEKATLYTGPRWPEKVRKGSCPPLTAHNFAVPSAPPVRSVCPSGAKATLLTPSS